MFISFVRNLCFSLPNRSSLCAVAYKPISSSYTSVRNTAAVQSEKVSIQISQSCVERLKKIASEGVFLRVAIDGGGCSGFQYRFDLDSQLNSDDICIQKDGAKVVVDSISFDFLKGATVDYHQELIRSAFRIVDNPQADSNCSCGTSFSVKDS